MNAPLTANTVYSHTSAPVNTSGANEPRTTAPKPKKNRVRTCPCRPALRFYELVWKFSQKKDEGTGHRKGNAHAYMKWYADQYNRDRSTIRRWVKELREHGIAEATQDERDQMLLIYPKAHISEVRAMLAFKPSPPADFKEPEIAAAAPRTRRKVSAPVSAEVSEGVSTENPSPSITIYIPTGNNDSDTPLDHPKHDQGQKAGVVVPEPIEIESKKTDTPSGIVTAIAAMDDHDQEAVHLLTAETIPAKQAVRFVQVIGSTLCRYHLDEYKRRKADGRAGGAGLLVHYLQNPNMKHYAGQGRTGNTPFPSPHAPDKARYVKVADTPAPVLPEGHGREAARLAIAKKRGGVSFGAWKG
ncbi:MAG: hypothetical protein V4671_30275 [Armatimonadota bacterium]